MEKSEALRNQAKRKINEISTTSPPNSPEIYWESPRKNIPISVESAPFTNRFCFNVKFWKLTNLSDDEAASQMPRPILREDHHSFLVYQPERCPRSKSPHIQGYVEFFRDVPVKLVSYSLGYAIKGYGTAWVSVAKGDRQQNIDYCTKEESRIGDPEIIYNE